MESAKQGKRVSGIFRKTNSPAPWGGSEVEAGQAVARFAIDDIEITGDPQSPRRGLPDEGMRGACGCFFCRIERDFSIFLRRPPITCERALAMTECGLAEASVGAAIRMQAQQNGAFVSQSGADVERVALAGYRDDFACPIQCRGAKSCIPSTAIP